jgi:hypothetical protein
MFICTSDFCPHDQALAPTALVEMNHIWGGFL